MSEFIEYEELRDMEASRLKTEILKKVKELADLLKPSFNSINRENTEI